MENKSRYCGDQYLVKWLYQKKKKKYLVKWSIYFFQLLIYNVKSRQVAVVYKFKIDPVVPSERQ